MARNVLSWAAILVLLAGNAGWAGADEVAVTDADRTFANFTRDAATVGDGQIRVELRGMRVEGSHRPDLDILGFPVDSDVNDINGGVIDVLGSYGFGESTEVGIDLPFFIQKTGRDGRASVNEEDIGDLLLYAKAKRSVAENCSIAGGLEVTLPTGADGKGFGTGETGLNPFLSGRYQRGRVGVGAHIGYQIFTGGVDDVLNYSVSLFLRGNEVYDIRTEVSGRLFEIHGTDYQDVTILPGIDFWVSDSFALRPTGLIGIVDEAMQWGIGVGIAMQL